MAMMLSASSFGALENADRVCRIDGTLEYFAYNSGQEVIHKRSAHFTVLKSARAWKVIMEPQLERASSTTATVQRYEYAYKTNTLFKATFFHNRVGVTNQVTKNVVAETGEFVHLDGSLIGPVWLAYASSGYFLGRTEGECPPVWSVPRAARQKMTIPYRSKKDDSVGIRRIEFMSSPLAPIDGADGEITMLPLPKNVGIFTNATLISISNANWFGHDVPQKAALTMVTFEPASEREAPTFYRAAEFLLTTASISEADAGLLSIASPKQRVYVSEYRLEGKRPIVYVSSDVLSLKDPKLIALAKSQQDYHSPLAFPRFLFWAASLLGLSICVYFAWQCRKRMFKER